MPGWNENLEPGKRLGKGKGNRTPLEKLLLLPNALSLPYGGSQMGSPGNIPHIHQRALQEQEKENSFFPLSSTHYQPAAPLFHTNSKELSQWDLPETLWIWF